jgi:23S rRNA pseudouridine1911/1915/1917 synthase
MSEELFQNDWNEITAEEEAPRLDSYLAQRFPSLSRTRIQKLVEEKYVKCNGVEAKSNTRILAGDKIEFFYPAPKSTSLKAENIPLEILFEDDQLIVVNKPAGLVVHPGAGNWEGTLVNALLHHYGESLSKGQGIGGELRPGIVHRIDQNTSGILLITKTDEAHKNLSLQFKEHTITRRYQGLCWGLLPEKGEWKDPIGRDPRERKRMAVVESGRKALTVFRKKSAFHKALTFFEAELFTGRTHQIRVHFSAHNFPLAGDATYIRATASARQAKERCQKILQHEAPEAAQLIQALQEKKRQFLHACHLGFMHPISKKSLVFVSDVPPDLREIMVALGHDPV